MKCYLCLGGNAVGGIEACPEATRGQESHVHLTSALCARDLFYASLSAQKAGTLVTVVAEEVMHGALREFGITVPILTAAQIVDELVEEFRREMDAV